MKISMMGRRPDSTLNQPNNVIGMLHEKKPAFYVSELVGHNWVVTVTDDGYKGLIYRILIEVGLYYLSIMRI